MKLRKILTPILATVGSAAIVTPLVCLTSCTGDLAEKDYFTFNVGSSKDKELYIQRSEWEKYAHFTLDYAFDANAEFQALPNDEKKVTPTVSFVSKDDFDYSYIQVNQCFGSYDDATKQIIVHVNVTIMLDYWERTKLDDEEIPKSIFSIKLTGTNWYKTYSGFSIELEAPTTK